jgi:Zn-dependent metalloprotease
MAKKWKKIISLCMTCALITGSLSTGVLASETEQTETDKVVETDQATETDQGAEKETDQVMETVASLPGQLTLEDLDALNGGKANVYTHNDRITLVDGTCTPDLVTSMDDAAAVVDSMITLIGGDGDTEFTPWRQVMDPLGNTYYIFQQIYHDTTVCGGAAKVITDADCNMIGLSCSVESEMPDVETGEGITPEEAQQIVLEKMYEATGLTYELLDQYTNWVILPSVLKFDFENEDESSRFVWVVYTNNPSGSVQNGSDLPYLAHYVSMSGEYLYNMPAIAPDDEAGKSGYDVSYIFEFMEPVEYTGYVDISDGTEKEITVTVMRDRRTGMYYLGNLERRIVVADCYPFLYEDGQVVLEASPDNLEWDQTGLLSLYNYCRAWDYYHEIGWDGGDGKGTPIIILNNFCDDHLNEVDNACYVGKVNGAQIFLASKINDFSQCLDILAHEFTHCVTGSLMTYNSYVNDYGAINEAISDIQAKNCEMMAGDVDPDNWTMGANSVVKVRSMSDPHLFQQPEYTWDEYYVANAKEPSSSNDHGGVHFNSSLLNMIGYYLVQEGGMSFDEARTFWFIADCATVPGTDYLQMAELLPWALKTAGMEQYEETLNAAIERTRLADKTMPETMDGDRAMIKLSLPDTEAFDTGNWMMLLTTVKLDDAIGRGASILQQLMNWDFSFLPESAQKLIEEFQKEEETEPKDWKEELFTAVTESLAELVEEEQDDETKTSEADQIEDKVLQDLKNWLRDEVRSLVFQSYGFAGQDGSTLNMVVRPGRSIPILQHAIIKEGSDQPDQIVFAVYVNGKWYDLGIGEMMTEEAQDTEPGEGDFSIQDLPMDILTDVLGENLEKLFEIRSKDDLLDLFTVDIQGGEILELSADGLDQIVIPEPTPPEEKTWGHIEPGKKSRPKLETDETEAEETEAADDTAAEAETAVEDDTGAETVEEDMPAETDTEVNEQDEAA